MQFTLLFTSHSTLMDVHPRGTYRRYQSGVDSGNGNNYSGEYENNMFYDDFNLGRMSSKSQQVKVDGSHSDALSSTFTGGDIYEYSNNDHPRAVSGIGHAPVFSSILYDANGNMTSNTGGINPSDKYMYWNTNNLMRGIKVDDYMIQHYMYDAEGQRILKSKGDITTVGTEGNNTTSAVLDPYTIYPSGHITMSTSGRYTKHYYSGSERIVSRLAGVNQSFISQEDMSSITTTQVDGELALLKSDLGVNTLTTSMYTAPTGEDPCIIQYPDTQSEAYKQCLCEYDPANCPEDVLYYFHSDQLGSSSVLTDADGNPYQFLVYLPWGEVIGEQKAAQFSTPYQFNGKELDQETGLYNYGARYYDPSLSLWLGVDPLADQMPSWSPYNYTFNNPINFTDPDGRAPEDGDGVDHEWVKYIYHDGREDYQKISDEGGNETHIEHTIHVGENDGEMTFGGTTKTKVNNDGNFQNAPITSEGIASGLTITAGIMTSAGAADGFDKFDKTLKSSKFLSKIATIGSVAGFGLTLYNTNNYIVEKKGKLTIPENIVLHTDIALSFGAMFNSRAAILAGAWEVGKEINNVKWRAKNKSKIFIPSSD